MTLRDAIEADAERVFLSESDFAETVTYHPHRYFGQPERQPRQIKAVVFREAIGTFDEDVVTNLPMFMVHVANDPETGISSDEIDTGGDQIEMPGRDGKTARRFSILRIDTQDHGMMVLECR